MNIIRQTPFNTNNDWGFGGGIGTEIEYDNGLIKRSGKLCYRHAPSHNFTSWYFKVDNEYKVNINHYLKKGTRVYLYKTDADHYKVLTSSNPNDQEMPETIDDYKLIKKTTYTL